MTRQEFLQGLREALEAETDVYTVRENIQYYDQYISDAVAGGRRESEVLEELGDPWVIARTILDAPGGTERSSYGQQYEEMEAYREPEYEEDEGRRTDVHIFRVDAWWKKLLLILAVAGVIFVVISIITGIISLVAPVLVPLVVVILVIRLIGNYRR